jgi:hypothetical protein
VGLTWHNSRYAIPSGPYDGRNFRERDDESETPRHQFSASAGYVCERTSRVLRRRPDKRDYQAQTGRGNELAKPQNCSDQVASFFGMMWRVVRWFPHVHGPHRAATIRCSRTKIGVVETSTWALEHWEPFDVQMPPAPGRHGGRLTEMFRPSPQDILEPGREPSITSDRDRVEGRSLIGLMSREPSTPMDAGGAHPSG